MEPGSPGPSRSFVRDSAVSWVGSGPTAPLRTQFISPGTEPVGLHKNRNTMLNWLYKRYANLRRECLPGVGDVAAVTLPALPVSYLLVFAGALGAFVTLAFAGHPLLLAAFALQLLLGAFGAFIFRAKR
jgi:hypothetical protein